MKGGKKLKLTQEELSELMKIRKEINKDLKQDEYYNNLLLRKEKILDYLSKNKSTNDKEKLLEKYEQIGNEIKEIEIKTAFKVLYDKMQKEKNKNKIIKGIINKLNKKNENDEYTEQFNKIVQDENYKEKIKKHKEIFKKLNQNFKEESDYIYELDSIETELATIETEKIKEYIINKL